MAHIYRHRSLLALLAAATLLVPLSGPASASANESSTSTVPRIQLALRLPRERSMFEPVGLEDHFRGPDRPADSSELVRVDG